MSCEWRNRTTRPSPGRAVVRSAFRGTIGCLASVLLAACAWRNAPIREYLNPLDVSVADPEILKDGDAYYLYGTSYAAVGFEVFTSRDLVHWRDHGFCFHKTDHSWGQKDFWAPEVIRKGSTYYLFHVAYNPASNVRNICVATSDSPLGPFHEATAPLFPAGRGFIDPSPFRDPATGIYYVYATEENMRPSKIWVARLSDDLLSLDSPLTECITATQPWEHEWVEAPFVIKHGLTYYMTYSGFGFSTPDYSIGVATAPSPLGPWTKDPNNPVVHRTKAVSGPGHDCVVASPDGKELFLVYHRHLTFAGGGARELAIDRIQFRANDDEPPRLVVDGPTSTPQPFPSGAPPHLRGRSDEFNGPGLDWSRWLSYGEDPDHWRVEDGCLCIDTESGDIFQESEDARNIFLQYAPAGDFAIETRVDFAPRKNYEQAFLLVWQDQSNYLRLATVYSDGRKLEVGQENDGTYRSTLVDNPFGSIVRLRIVKRGSRYEFFAAADPTSGDRAHEGNRSAVEWTRVGPTRHAHFHQIKVGLGAIAPVSGARRTARFDYFRLQPCGW